MVKKEDYRSFKLSKAMQGKRSEMQYVQFQEFAEDLFDTRKVLSHPRAPELTDEQWHTICHNVSWMMIDYQRSCMRSLYNLK